MVDYWEMFKIVASFIPLIILFIYFFGYLTISYEEIFMRYYRKIDKYDILNEGVKNTAGLVFILLIILLFIILNIYRGDSKDIMIPVFYLVGVLLFWYFGRKLNYIENLIVERGWLIAHKKNKDEKDEIIYLNCWNWIVFKLLPYILILFISLPAILYISKFIKSGVTGQITEIFYFTFFWLFILIIVMMLLIKYQALSQSIIYVKLFLDIKKLKETKIPLIKKGIIYGILVKESNDEYIIYHKDLKNREFNHIVRKDYVISCENSGVDLKFKKCENITDLNKK